MRIRVARVQPEQPIADDASGLQYWDREVGVRAAKVLPGEYLVSGADIALVTLLGSCVAACLRDPGTGIGGINHFMLPEGRLGVASESARYGGFAMELLINELLKQGAARARLEAKVFGGGNVLSGFTRANVGEQNAAFVKEYLQRERIPVVAEDLRGLQPRKIWYFPRTGRTLVKTLPNASEVRNLERLYEDRLQHQPVASGDVELFE